MSKKRDIETLTATLIMAIVGRRQLTTEEIKIKVHQLINKLFRLLEKQKSLSCDFGPEELAAIIFLRALRNIGLRQKQETKQRASQIIDAVLPLLKKRGLIEIRMEDRKQKMVAYWQKIKRHEEGL